MRSPKRMVLLVVTLLPVWVVSGFRLPRANIAPRRAPPARCAWRAGCSPRPVERLTWSRGTPAPTSPRRLLC